MEWPRTLKEDNDSVVRSHLAAPACMSLGLAVSQLSLQGLVTITKNPEARKKNLAKESVDIPKPQCVKMAVRATPKPQTSVSFFKVFRRLPNGW
jgi:hypothetical protein